MNKSLLRNAAIQSLALMIAVITFSYALSQYRIVTTAASSNIAEGAEGTDSTNDSSRLELTAVQKQISGADANVLEKLGNNYLIVRKPQGNDLKLQLEDLYIKESIQLTITGLTSDQLTSSMISRVREDRIYTGDPKYTESTSMATDNHGKKQKVITRDYNNDLCHGITITMKKDPLTGLYTAKILIALDSVYAYMTYQDSNYFYIKLQKPSEVYNKVLVIDAGHGGKDAGAISANKQYYEKDINLYILQDLKKLLDKEKDIKVYYTRTGDDKVFLRPRVTLADAVDCDYFISIHCNANEYAYPNGTEILYYNEKFKGVRNSDLAKLFSEELAKTTALKNRGTVKKHLKDIFIMDKATVPMILIETGYLTNNNDMWYLSNNKNRQAVARGIFNGIMKAYKNLAETPK